MLQLASLAFPPHSHPHPPTSPSVPAAFKKPMLKPTSTSKPNRSADSAEKELAEVRPYPQLRYILNPTSAKECTRRTTHSFGSGWGGSGRAVPLVLGVFSHDSAFSPPPQPLMDDAGQVEAPSLNASGVAAAVVTAAFAGATEHLIAKGTRDEVSAPAAPQLKSASTLESDTSKLVAEVQYVERSK